MPHAHAASRSASARSEAAKSGLAKLGDAATLGEAAASGEGARFAGGDGSGSPELRWTAPRRGSHEPANLPPSSAAALWRRQSRTYKLLPMTREKARGCRYASGIGGNGQQSGQHRPSRSERTSGPRGGGRCARLGLNLTGQPLDLDDALLICMSSTYSRLPLQTREVDLDAPSTSGSEQALRVEQLGQAEYAGDTLDQSQHLGQLDENCCWPRCCDYSGAWGGCMRGAPDLTSTGEGSPAKITSRDPRNVPQKTRCALFGSGRSHGRRQGAGMYMLAHAQLG
ncbi:g3087 [Coccomyxa elongata]